MALKPENYHRNKMQERLKELFGKRVWIQKNHQGAMSGSGLPDLEVQLGTGHVYLELKYVDGVVFDFAKQPTELQKDTLRKIWLAGGNVGVLVYFEAWGGWAGLHGNELIEAFMAKPKLDQLLHWRNFITLGGSEQAWAKFLFGLP